MKKPHPYSAASVSERCEGTVAEARTLAYLLLTRVEDSLNTSRGTEDGEIITLKFSKESILATCWLAGKLWSALAKLDDFIGAAQDAQAEAEEKGRALV